MASSRPALTETPQRNQPHWSRPVNSGPRPCLFSVGFPLSGLQDRTSTSDLNVRTWHTRLVRYADDWVVLVAGDRAHAEALRDQAAAVLATMGLRLSLEKTRIAHIDEGFDFLGRHIQRHTKRGTKRQHVYTYPSKDALASIKDKVRAGTQRTSTNQSLADLCDRLNPALRGWTTHFRHDVSKANFSYLSAFLWKRTVRWLRKKHPRASWKQLRRLYLPE